MPFIPSWKHQVLPKARVVMAHLRRVLPVPSRCYSHTVLRSQQGGEAGHDSAQPLLPYLSHPIGQLEVVAALGLLT